MTAQPLGVVLAGGLSRRFGSDKALALVGGRPMLDHVIARLRPQCADLVVAGRQWPGASCIDDLPHPGLGPLGGLAAALAYARGLGHELVLTCGCDLPELPGGLVALLSPADAVLTHQPTIGLWRADRSDMLLAWIEASRRHSIFAWAEEVGARQVAGPAIVNVNRPEDLEAIRPPADPRSSR
ncbi:molybdenum cofactor guanylyltransferase [Sphingomonas sp.]|uniref:molybdenum cofactor guanylyltransferase n=1 Tax=Sphingomonas sp. TaxID=28214 RepID=UPI003B00B06A